VTATEIAASAVSADKIAANAITATKIAADAVTADKIAANAVEADAIAANAITTGKIAAGAVNADQIAANAITSGKIFAGAVTADKVATDAITANKIAAGSIITSKLAAGSVTANNMAADSITAENGAIKNLSVDTIKIASGAISASTLTSSIISVNVTAGSTTSPSYLGVITPDEARFASNPSEFRLLGTESFTVSSVDASAAETIDFQLSVGISPSWQLNSSSSSITEIYNWIYVRALIGTTLVRSSAVAFQGSSQYRSQMMYSYFNRGSIQIYGLEKGVDYAAGDTIDFDVYYCRYRSATRWGIGQNHTSIGLLTREFFR
jgi:hypothetical protein